MRKLLKNICLATCVLLSAQTIGHAGELKGVVELFTSQGCSSCPPADAALSKLIEDGDVVALSYHVDYWDYLGWKDTLGSPESTERQYAYARTFQRRSVYTPQAVLNGRDHINGGDYRGIKRALNSYDAIGDGLEVDIDATIVDGKIEISVGEGVGSANLMIVYFDRQNTVDIQRGENRGKQITYHHSVRDMQTVGMWDGKSKTLTLPASMLGDGAHGGCAILLQTVGHGGVPGAIIGANVLMAAATN